MLLNLLLSIILMMMMVVLWKDFLFLWDLEIVLVELVDFSVELFNNGSPSKECLVISKRLLINTMLDHLHELA
jgi:hypothetical protein